MRFRASLIPPLAVVLSLGACGHSPTEPSPGAEAIKQEDVAPAKIEAEIDPTPNEVVANGVFAGRSGKPMAKARLVLGKVVSDEDFSFAKVNLVADVSTAVADAEGRFQFKGFAPGTYTIVYQPTGASSVFPVEIPIKTLSATDKSITPLLRRVELGTNEPFSEREWGRRFTLLEGYTLWSEGPTMRIRNATVRHLRTGPYLEMRRSVLWTGQFDDNSEIKFEAWSY
jgi:hypothetical protein